MTLFSYRFPLEFVYRVLDSVFAEGIEAIFRFAVGLMSGAEEDLLKLNFEQALAYLKNTQIFDQYKTERNADGGSGAGAEAYDVDRFARQAYAVQIHSSSLDGYAAEFEESVKAATAHRRELEAARIVNRNLAAKVAELEDQLEKIQGEHVELVKDVVLSKVAKEETEEELVSSGTGVVVQQISAVHAGRSSGLTLPSPRRGVSLSVRNRSATRCSMPSWSCKPIKPGRTRICDCRNSLLCVRRPRDRRRATGVMEAWGLES
jgi:hypothetical protein